MPSLASTTFSSIVVSCLAVLGLMMRVRAGSVTATPPTFATTCGVTRYPPLAIAAYARTSWSCVAVMPCPKGMLTAWPAFHLSFGRSPEFSPATSTPVPAPNPNLAIHARRRFLRLRSFERRMVPMLLERCRICVVVIVSQSVRLWASWMVRCSGVPLAMTSFGGRLYAVFGVVSPSSSAPATVHDLEHRPRLVRVGHGAVAAWSPA